MKIIFANRSDSLIRRGGDTFQMLLTKKYLESLYGLEIDLCFDPVALNRKSFDIMHLFNIQTIRQSKEFIDVAIKKKSKIVLTPIYWNLKFAISYYVLSKICFYKHQKEFQFLSDPIIALNKLLSGDRYLSNNYKSEIRYILTNSDIILPNSDEEWEIIKEHFKISKLHNHTIVPNAIELPDSPRPLNVIKYKTRIIQVGRISPNKNQLGTLLALFEKPELSLYFIGQVEDNNYYKHLYKKAAKRGNVFFVDEVNQEELYTYYEQSAIHVLPSFRESPGLVSLEAFLNGCEIVVSDSRFAPVNYYRFNEIAHICNPYDPISIQRAIINALNMPKNASSKEKYFDFFNYSTVAEKTFQSYKSLINE